MLKQLLSFCFRQDSTIIKMEDVVCKNLANALSTLTILSSLFLKVPQIMYIRNKKSAEGIVIQAMLMEIFG